MVAGKPPSVAIHADPGPVIVSQVGGGVEAARFVSAYFVCVGAVGVIGRTTHHTAVSVIPGGSPNPGSQ